MNSRLSFRPDLIDAILEDRVLMASGVPSFLYPAASPMILTTSGFVMITTPSVIASSTGTGVLSIGLGVYGGGFSGPGVNTSYSVSAFGLAFYAASVSAANLLEPSGSDGGNTLTAGLVGSGANENGGAGGGRSTVTIAVVGGTQNGGSVFQFVGQVSGGGMVAPAPTNGQRTNGAGASGANGPTQAPPPQIGAPSPAKMNPMSGTGLPIIPNAVPTLPKAPGSG